MSPISAATQSAASVGTPPELTGGDGFSYEDAVAAVYVASLLCESTALGLPGYTVAHVAVQQGSFGQPLDDVIVQGRSANGMRMTLSLQVKRGLRISSAKTNDDFRETIERAHRTVEADGFVEGVDRVGAVVGKISDASRDAFQTLCEWARSETSPAKFEEKLSTDGAAGPKREQYQAVKDLLSPIVTDAAELSAVAHRLLAHFILLRLEMLTEGSLTEAQTVAQLATALAPEHKQRADDLWRRLLALVRVSEGRAAGYDRKTLVHRLRGAYKLAGAPSLAPALQALSRESRLAAADITDSIAGLRVPRQGHAEAVLEATKSPGFVQIAGVAGSGKSVVLRAAVEAALQTGPVLFLKSDRLQGTTWPQYAALSGYPQVDLTELLIELGASGSKVVFVDGIDRIELPHQKVLLDVLGALETSGLLPEWTLVATVRDSGLEPLRTWLPRSVLQHGVKVLTVDSFDDEEAKVLAQARPQLHPLLFGTEAVKAVVRRPFFAAVLAKELESGNQTATSEVDLASLWWQRGGYAADAARAGHRRNALVQLAKSGAHQLGRRISIESIDPEALAELESDGIVRPVKVGHTVKFTHDIFFEWAFLQHLIRQEKGWVQAVREVGEPPALGRVVELLSQAELASSQSWGKYLVQLESDLTLRSQWLRAWMTGPFSLESFEEHASTVDALMFQESAARVAKLVVWYQAEKTRPNSNILAVTDSSFDATTRLRYADLLGWPADVPSWRRFCTWLLDHAADLPTSIIPDVVAAFGVWQNLASQVRNLVSQRIVRTCLAWLYHIEQVRHPKEWSSDVGAWKELRDKDDELKELEDTLRRMILSAGLTERTLVAQYVNDLSRFERMPRSAVGAVFDNAAILSHACPAELADFTLRAVRQELPVASERRSRGEDFRISRGVGHWDFDHLAIDDQYAFLPAAPTREPFHALLQVAPDQGRRLVREVCNHAITAWRQLQRLSYEKDGTPIPVVMQFPWGQQVFWGDFRTYVGSRGSFGPACVNSALMALELWGFNRLEAGDNVDDVLRAVLEGHKSVGVLQVAAALSLHAQQCSDVTLPIATNQRLWHWDIHRFVQESSPANEIGFTRPADLPHAKAIRASNQRGVRKVDIRSLATLIVLRGGELGARAAQAIRNFPNELPFDYTQERRNNARAADLAETAQLWAEVGDLKNYKVEAADDQSKLVITHENPKAVGPQFDAMKQRNEELGRNLKLLNWTLSYFSDGVLKEQPFVEEAVALAKELDSEDLFETGHDHVSLDHQRQSAVAGVAAMVLDKNFEEHLEWAVRICLRAAFTPEAPNELFVRQAHLMHHPVLFAARGLRAAMKLAQDKEDQAFVQANLTRIVSHPYEEIAIEALAGLLGAWGEHPHVGWAGLRLATAISIVEARFDAGSGEARRFEENGQLVTAEIERVEANSEGVPAMPSWPDPWMQLAESEVAPRRRRRGPREGDDELLRWVPGRTQVDTQFLSKVLAKIPFPQALEDTDHAAAFLDWCEGLARWTVERVAPSWAANPRVVEDHFRANLYEWSRTLYRFLAGISLRLPAQEGIRRFLQPAMDKHDDAFGNLCESATRPLVAAIADDAQIPTVAFELLSALRERMLKHRDWGYAASSGRADNELVSMVKDLFFELPYAGGAVRFANRDWRDVGKIIHVFEPILRAHGSVEFVARFWMSLLEASIEHYPLEHFVRHLEFVLGPTGRPGGWRHTQLPARLAALIQRFSERSQVEPLVAQMLLCALDRLVDMGDRRAAAAQLSEVFRSVRVAG